MNALETLLRIAETKLYLADLKYCVVNKDKMPLKIDGSPCRPNVDTDFVNLEDLDVELLDRYAGIGISIKASKVCAIDVDHCFSKAFDIKSGDDRAKYFIDMFKDVAYIEFSFSGQGLRILFLTDTIEDYSTKYYIKNSLNKVEYYQPNGSARYVTLTGKYIVNNEITYSKQTINKVYDFLEKYMKKKVIIQTNLEELIETENKSLDELLIDTKRLYLKNSRFQYIWFSKAPGSGKNESELDYEIIAFLYENITKNKDMIRQIFETSDYYESKDFKHKSKWKYNEYRYFNYQYDNVRRSHR